MTTSSPPLLVRITVTRAVHQAEFDQMCKAVDDLIKACDQVGAQTSIFVGEKEFVIPKETTSSCQHT